MTRLVDLKAFDIESADVSIWTFRQSTQDKMPVFTAHWVGTTDALDAALKDAVKHTREAITETIEYDILAQNNEGSALTIGSNETHVHLIAEKVANETPKLKAKKIEHISNIDFYAVKFTTEDGCLLAIRKANSSWSTKHTKGIIRAVFSDQELDLDENPSFNIDPIFDFFVLNDRIFISGKRAFESVLSYRDGHIAAFDNLKVEKEFASIFSDIGPINEFVGSNKIQLRRAIAIREKGHYKDPNFMKNLREMCTAMNLQIEFDNAGRILPTPETCRDIFQALLDHRLDSRLSGRLYDVQNTEPVK